MLLRYRSLKDRYLSGLSLFSMVLMGSALAFLLAPILIRGWGAFCFRATVEHRRFVHAHLGRGSPAAVAQETARAAAARAPVYAMIEAFERELSGADAATRRARAAALKDVKRHLAKLLGPLPGSPRPMLLRDQFGETRWDQARERLQAILWVEEWDYSRPETGGVKSLKPRAALFAGTSLEPLFAYLETNLEAVLLPRRTFYWRFLTDEAFDAHFFGGIWPEMLGTFYLAVGAMLFAVPFGVLAAIFLTEYASDNAFVAGLRICISTLAGVPSIVFGLFGLAFFINTLRVSHSKSVLAGSLTLSLMVLPTIIRASEEALRAVPRAYREAALSLGASPWHALVTVVLPTAMPGILTGIIISLGRAAGETAPIIFTAAVSVGRALRPLQTLTQPTPALSWNLYNLATEHAAADELRHVQYGMALTLVGLVLLLNLTAIIVRGRMSRRLQ